MSLRRPDLKCPGCGKKLFLRRTRRIGLSRIPVWSVKCPRCTSSK